MGPTSDSEGITRVWSRFKSVKSNLHDETPTQYAERYGHTQMKSMLLEYEDVVDREPFTSGRHRAGPEIRSTGGI